MNISTHFSPAQPMTLSARPSVKPSSENEAPTTSASNVSESKVHAADEGATVGTHVDTTA